MKNLGIIALVVALVAVILAGAGLVNKGGSVGAFSQTSSKTTKLVGNLWLTGDTQVDGASYLTGTTTITAPILVSPAKLYVSSTYCVILTASTTAASVTYTTSTSCN
jgi:hypothetical protein